MNLKSPYEKHLAEKLVQLPPPGDPDQNWQQMKSLLDRDMPRGGGRGGPGGSYRWWVAGTVVVAVMVGTWFGGKQLITREQRNESVAGTIKTVSPATTAAGSNDHAAPQQPAASFPNNAGAKTATVPADPKGAAYAAVNSTQPNEPAGTRDASPQATTAANDATPNRAGTVTGANAPTAPARNNTITPANALPATEHATHARSSTTQPDNAGLVAANNNKRQPANSTSNNNKTSHDRKNIYSNNNNSGNETSSNNTSANTSNNNNTARTHNRKTGNSNTARHRNTGGRINNNNSNGVKGDNNDVAASDNHNAAAAAPVTAGNKNGLVNKQRGQKAGKQQKAGRQNHRDAIANDKPAYTYTPAISLPSQPTSGEGLKASPVTISVNYTGAVVIAPSGVITREFTYYSPDELFPDAQQSSTARNTHRTANRNSYSPEDKTFALGLSLPLAFPLGDQQALSINQQGKMNTLSDYIPALHLQYHLNSKTYLQTQLQIAAPQYIRPILLYEKEKMMQTNMEVINTTYARKLYYFNLPVTIHHSPLRNFYMGAGLQLSSLVSGVAQSRQVKRYYPLGPGRPPEDYMVSNYYTKFRNDSLSGKFNKNELRLLIDMSYYWNRFTVGLQYSQAFNNYVSFQVSPAAPYTFDKNKSLQFYLRYNIWEDKKRKNAKNQPMLTLK